MLIPSMAFPAAVIICMIILHPVESTLRKCLCQCLGEERGFCCLFRDLSNIFHFFLLSLAVLSGDGDVLKMLSARCFSWRQYLYALFPGIIPLGCEARLGALLYPISFTQTEEAILYTPNKKSWIGHFTDEHSEPIPPRNPRKCKSL